MRGNRWGIGLAVLFLGAANAWAEPYLAAWKGVNCNACHVNQTGGYLRNDFGKNYGNSLQTFDWQGIAEEAQKIQHNTPSFIAMGIDIHQGYMTTWNYRQPTAQNTSSFTTGIPPLSRQDFSFQVKANEVVSGVFTYRLDENVTKEAYGLVSGLPAGGYIKFGNFMLPYGLNLSDDQSLVRLALEPTASTFTFDSPAIGAIEAGIYPDPVFLNVALTSSQSAAITLPSGQMVQNEKIVSAKGGIHYSEFTLGGSFYGTNLDEPSGTSSTIPASSVTVLYGPYGWGRIGPVVILGEYDQGYNEGIVPGGIQQDNIYAYHVSAEADLGNSVYLRLTREWYDDNLHLSFFDETRQVLTLRCYPVRNLRTQLDFTRVDPYGTSNQPNYSLLADAFVFY